MVFAFEGLPGLLTESHFVCLVVFLGRCIGGKGWECCCGLLHLLPLLGKAGVSGLAVRGEFLELVISPGIVLETLSTSSVVAEVP